MLKPKSRVSLASFVMSHANPTSLSQTSVYRHAVSIRRPLFGYRIAERLSGAKIGHAVQGHSRVSLSGRSIMKSSHLVAILLVWMLPLTTHSLAASYDIVDLGAFPGTLSVSGLN